MHLLDFYDSGAISKILNAPPRFIGVRDQKAHRYRGDRMPLAAEASIAKPACCAGVERLTLK